ncbi:hypothetical protein [Mesorhizobium sp.]|uniref:hypothetical protein n=1 Tax=Mesorhizobium sp. TaxID=1871066 RepID=UPI0025C42AC5|nr:hypothetical protein [Mesorhizobium sp.]
MVSPVTNEPPLGRHDWQRQRKRRPVRALPNPSSHHDFRLRRIRLGGIARAPLVLRILKGYKTDVERLSDKHVARPVRQPRFALLTKASFEQAPSPA